MAPKVAKLFEIHTAEEWVRDYGAGHENYVPPKLDAKNVPRSLRKIVPLAADWGIADDLTRNHKLCSLSEDEFMRLYYHLRRYSKPMNRFVDRVIRFDHNEWTTEERCFLYLSMCYGELSATAYWILKKRRANKSVDPTPVPAPRKSGSHSQD